jgi:hypothetical protein
MNTSRQKINLLVSIFMVICLLSSCIPIIHRNSTKKFKNCTNDTLVIGVSHCNDIDSVERILWHISNESRLLAKGIQPWHKNNMSAGIILPDSICGISGNYLSCITDTCYFFLVKLKDAKRYSWDEIRTKKLFRRWIVTRDKEGKFDKNIRYSKANGQ